jgi:hypothetical protein
MIEVAADDFQEEDYEFDDNAKKDGIAYSEKEVRDLLFPRDNITLYLFTAAPSSFKDPKAELLSQQSSFEDDPRPPLLDKLEEFDTRLSSEIAIAK